MPKRAINKTLFRRVRNHILAEPRRYNQAVVGDASKDAPCGTVACLFGWAAVLAGITSEESIRQCGYYAFEGLFPKISKALGLTERQSQIVSDRYADEWPEPFRSQYIEATDKPTQARAAANYINHIIRTGKVTA